MNRDTGPNMFVTYTPANFHNRPPTLDTPARQQEGVEVGDGPLRRLQQVAAPADVSAIEFQTITRVLGVLNEGGMDVVGFLDALSWGNQLAIMDPTHQGIPRSLSK